MKRLTANEITQELQDKSNEIKKRLNNMISEKDPYNVVYKGNSILTDNPSDFKFSLLRDKGWCLYNKLTDCDSSEEREALLMSPSKTDNGTVGDQIGRIVDQIDDMDRLGYLDTYDDFRDVLEGLRDASYEYVNLMNEQRTDNRQLMHNNPSADIGDMKEAMQQVDFTDLTPSQMCQLYSEVEQFEHNTNAERISDIMLTLDDMGIEGIDASVVDDVFECYDRM